ncbi:hypothetical protein CEXT_810791 [Caerostris extrusa]|uniref:Uncharacterized protein n=1 Tax=Caerostris extrusa TaxID=172846 RepID=A0AAV4WVF2_CAEEX|nr:hypothetical protein CEXT_810791 [Caerostris extrusa]
MHLFIPPHILPITCPLLETATGSSPARRAKCIKLMPLRKIGSLTPVFESPLDHSSSSHSISDGHGPLRRGREAIFLQTIFSGSHCKKDPRGWGERRSLLVIALPGGSYSGFSSIR